MARRYARLTERQVAVLSWVDQGCPAGVWDGFSYKTTAYALANRGLVTVDRRRQSWGATITDEGRFYLEHGRYTTDLSSNPPPAAPRKAKGKTSSTRAVPAISPERLLAELQAAGGQLAVPDPRPELRAAYRSALSRATSEQLIPAGYVLRHRGRDRGDLVVRLVSVADLPPERPHLDSIPVPESLEQAHDAIATLRADSSNPLQVSDNCRTRALLISQAIAAECDRRGLGFTVSVDAPDGGGNESTFQITVGANAFEFVLFEEHERGEVIDADELAEARYEWQRVQPSVRQVPTGRLVLRHGSGYGARSWADRKRWRLDDKLAEVFAYVEEAAAAAAERRETEERVRRDRRQAWEVAVPLAKKAYIDSLNRERLAKQVAAVTQAGSLRDYANQLEQSAAKCPDAALTDQITLWAAWARREADRIDPLANTSQLTYVTPRSISPADYDEFMPRGMSSWHPPD